MEVEKVQLSRKNPGYGDLFRTQEADRVVDLDMTDEECSEPAAKKAKTSIHGDDDASVLESAESEDEDDAPWKDMNAAPEAQSESRLAWKSEPDSQHPHVWLDGCEPYVFIDLLDPPRTCKAYS